MYNNNWTSGHLMNCLDPDFLDGKEAKPVPYHEHRRDANDFYL